MTENIIGGIMKYLKGPNVPDTSFYYRWHSEKLANNKVGNSMPFHIHQSAEFIIVVSGEIKVTAGTEPERTLGPMQAAFITPFRPHKYSSLPNTEYLRCNFIPSLLPDFFPMIEGKVSDTCAFSVKEATLRYIVNKIDTDSVESIWGIRSFLYAIIDDFLASVSLVKSSGDGDILTRALTYMNENKKNDLTVGEVAQAIGYSKSHLSFSINKAAGFSFSTLLSMLRIEEAKIMLKGTKRSILDISLECGFGSERNFYRQFKSITGVSPKEYRESKVFRAVCEPSPKK